jgi:tetratricopeptide (TPR) repeat protein
MRRTAKKTNPAPTRSSTPVTDRMHFPVWLTVGFLVLATVLAYQPVWHAGFIWDDDHYVTNNQTLRTLDGLQQIWCNLTATPQYYPLVYTSFWLEYHLWGLNPLGYHLVNVLLHVLAAILLWLVLLRLQVPGACLAAGIFALHPITVESVAWVTERKNVLAAVFYFASALLWLQWTWQRADGDKQIRGSFHWYLLAFALFIAALLSKTITCSLPAAMLLVIWWKHGRIAGRDVWPLLPFFCVGVGMGLVTSWLERTHVGAQGPGWDFSFSERILIAGRAVWFYAGKLFWPANLEFNYPRWLLNSSMWWQWIFPVAALLLVVALWSLRRRMGRGPLVAVLFFGGTLLPALGFTNVYPMRYSFVADHFQYLASVGLIVLATAGILMAFDYFLRIGPWLKLVFCGSLLLTLAVLTWRQCRMYADAETLWQTTIDRNPASWMAHDNLNNILFNEGQMDEAIVQSQKALEINPDDGEAYNNLGTDLFRKGQVDEAIIDYHKSLLIRPGNVEARNNLGTALLQIGQVDEAVTQLQQVLEVQPDFASANYNLGNALIQKGQMDEAIVQFQRALAIQPDNADAHNNLAAIFLQMGRMDEAIAQFKKAIEIKPAYVGAINNLGTALVRKGEMDEAIIQFQKALTIQPDLVEAQNNVANIAWVLATSSDPSIRNGTKAVELAQQTDKLSGGSNPGIAATLAAAYAEAGQFPEAMTTAKRALQLATSQNNAALVAALEAQIKLYQAGSPIRDNGISR